MRIAALSIISALTFIAISLYNRPMNVQPLILPQAPTARNKIHFPPIEQHTASSPSPATSTYINIIVVHP